MMALPAVSLPTTRQLPDILSTGRMALAFAPIPGVADDGFNSIGAAGLYVKKAEVTLPPLTIGQVRVPILGHPLAFRGGYDNQNRFTAAIYEDSRGGTLRTLLRWMEYVRSLDTGSGAYLQQYSVVAQVIAHDTKGAVAYTIDLENVWPTVVTPPPSSDDMQAARIACEFSVGFIGLKNTYAQDNLQAGSGG